MNEIDFSRLKSTGDMQYFSHQNSISYVKRSELVPPHKDNLSIKDKCPELVPKCPLLGGSTVLAIISCLCDARKCRCHAHACLQSL